MSSVQVPAADLGRKTLIVDDSPTARTYLQRLLKPHCEVVHMAADGLEAQAACRNEGGYDLILLDLELQDDCGLSLLRALREFSETCCIVMVTGKSKIHSATEAMRDGADGYITKQHLKVEEPKAFLGALQTARQRRAGIAAHATLEREAARLTATVQSLRMQELTDANRRLLEVGRLKSEFLAMVSHELRTPLNTVNGFTELMLEVESKGLSEQHQEYLGLVQDAGRHLLTLINDLLDVSCIEAGKMSVHAQDYLLRDCLQAALHSIGPALRTRSVVLRLEGMDEVPPLYGDPGRIRQILANLLHNAAKFTSQGEIRVRCAVTESVLTVTVQDTGIGIAPERMSHIFEAFTQAEGNTARRYGGTGLGLHLSRRLAMLLGGSLTVQSRLGEGSAFTLSVPRAWSTPDRTGPAPALAA